MSGPQGMTPSRPYLLRAMHEWLVDNGLTPQIVVDATDPELDVPPGFEDDGRVGLNLSPSAVRGLVVDDAAVRFRARFSGRAHDVLVPMHCVLAIVARENGAGMPFPAEDGFASPPEPEPEPTGPKRPALKVVK